MDALPPDTRPYRRASEPGEDQTVVRTNPDGTRVGLRLHQVGWHGQTGAFYALDEKPSQFERGSFAPLWIVDDVWPAEFEPVAYAVIEADGLDVGDMPTFMRWVALRETLPMAREAARSLEPTRPGAHYHVCKLTWVPGTGDQAEDR